MQGSIAHIKGRVLATINAFIDPLMIKHESRRTDDFMLCGDIHNLDLQKRALGAKNIDVIDLGQFLYGLKTEEDYIFALVLFYEEGIPGWSSYRDDLLHYKICPSLEEFYTLIDRNVRLGKPM
jgi:hypothetical protein